MSGHHRRQQAQEHGRGDASAGINTISHDDATLYRYYAPSVDVVRPLLQGMVPPAQGPISHTPVPRLWTSVPALSSGNLPCPAQWDFDPSTPPKGAGTLLSQQRAPCI